MNRRWTALAVPAVALSVALSGVGSASAATKPVIRTATGHTVISYTGIGRDAGWYYHDSQQAKVVLTPAYEQDGTDQWAGSQATPGSARDIVVGGVSYYNSGSGWKSVKLTAANLSVWRQHSDPNVSEAKFRAVKGVHWVGTRHYRVAGGYAQVGSFLAWEYFLGSKSLSSNQIKGVTIDLWNDPAGRPVKISVYGSSSIVRLSITETFFNYNQPVTITAPK
jgi:hypothetical protein